MMSKAFTQIVSKLEALGTLIAMLQRVEAKVDRLLTLLEAGTPAATAKTMPKGGPVVQVDETTADKMNRAGDFTPARGKR